MEIRNNMGFINCTPHQIVVQLTPEDGYIFEPSGVVPRVGTIEEPTGLTYGIPTMSRRLGVVEGLPPILEGTVYIVSSMVLESCPDRQDLVAPDTGATAIRNSSNQVEAVTRFVKRQENKQEVNKNDSI